MRYTVKRSSIIGVALVVLALGWGQLPALADIAGEMKAGLPLEQVVRNGLQTGLPLETVLTQALEAGANLKEVRACLASAGYSNASTYTYETSAPSAAVTVIGPSFPGSGGGLSPSF